MWEDDNTFDRPDVLTWAIFVVILSIILALLLNGSAWMYAAIVVAGIIIAVVMVAVSLFRGGE